jgi:hypothetical protein
MTSARRLATVLAAGVVGHSAGIGAGQPGTLGHAANHSAIRVLWLMDCGSNPALS